MSFIPSFARYDIGKFDGSNDFNLWKTKMRALLENLGLEEALEAKKKLPENATKEQKKDFNERRKEINKRAYNTLILSLGDKALREVSRMETAEALWSKLESLYMTKTLSNRLYLKAKFFTFKMQEGQKLNNHTDEFNKLCLDLENIDINYDEEDKVPLVLLHYLPRTYETFVDILKHGREKLSLEDVFGASNSKELQ